jgi:PAS domain S-box-containing protein
MDEPSFRCLTTGLSTLAMGSWRADGTLFDGNDALLQLLGCSRHEIESGRVRWHDITPGEFAPLDAQALDELRATGECTPFEKEYIRHDGRRVPVLVGGTAFGNGITDAGAFFAVDLSKRKRITHADDPIPPNLLALTERQRIICLLLSYGDTDKQIATALDMGLRTIEADKRRAGQQLDIATSKVAIWSVEHRRALVACLKGSGQLPKRVAEIANQR